MSTTLTLVPCRAPEGHGCLLVFAPHPTQPGHLVLHQCLASPRRHQPDAGIALKCLPPTALVPMLPSPRQTSPCEPTHPRGHSDDTKLSKK